MLESSVLASGLGIVASIIETVPLEMPAEVPDIAPEVGVPVVAPEATPVLVPVLAPVLEPALEPALAPALEPDSALLLEPPHAASHAREASAAEATSGVRVTMPQRLPLREAPSNLQS
jgi:hypothetical protein